MSSLSEFQTPWGHDPLSVLLARAVDARCAMWVAEGNTEKMQADLVGLARTALSNAASHTALAEYLGYMLTVAVVQDHLLGGTATRFNAIVPEANLGLQTRQTQRERRQGKPASSDDYDPDRNERIRRHHARLVADGRHDATTQTATEFDLSPRQVSRILKAEAKG